MQARVTQRGGPVVAASLEPGTTWIGTSGECGIRVTGVGVGARHARLDVTADGRFSIVDLGCSGGTRVNGERIVTAGPLGEWDLVRVGDCEIRIGASEPYIGAEGVMSRSAVTDAPELESPPHGEAFMAAARRAHQSLLAQFDLRRRDVASMSDSALRELASSLLQPVVSMEAASAGSPPEALLRFVLDEALGLGPLESLLADDGVKEIMVNGPQTIFAESQGRIVRTPARFSGEGALRGIVERIVSPLGRRVDESSPMVDARLPDGSRVNIVLPPLSLRGTTVTIRRFGRTRLCAEDLVAKGTMSAAMLQFLKHCVLHRRNLLVSGGTGSGKTTLLNVLSSLIPRHERVITIEDSAELVFDHPNLVSLETRPGNIEGRGEVTVRDLVRNSLRMRPDRIVIGECRGGETLDMLQAMNTGHDGSLSTVHANSPRELLSRLEVMVLMSGVELPLQAIREQVASSVHIIVHQARFACGARRVTRITEVTGVASGIVQMQDIFRFEADGSTAGSAGRFHAVGHVPHFYESLARSGIVLDLDLFSSAACGTGMLS
jgi:pilus assembly protein CpaF